MAKNSTKIQYDRDMLSLLNDLCSINESVIIKKEDKKLSVLRANNAKSVVYRLSMEQGVFDFEGDSIAFYKFPEFFQLLSCFETPDLHQADNKLILSKDKSKINYLLSDAETLQKGPSKVKFDNPQVAFELKSADIKEIKKMIGLLTAANTKFSCSKNKVDITCYNNGNDNSFTKSYETNKSSKEFEFTISSEIFALIPDGDYSVELMENVLPNKETVGIVRFTLQKKEISLEIFTAQIDEE